MDKEFLNPRDLPDWRPAFSQVVIVKAGGVRTIYVAGQVSVNVERRLVGSLDRDRKGYVGARAQIISRAHNAFG